MFAFSEPPAMSVERKPPGLVRSHFIEWQAARICDPVARLRYLNRKATVGRCMSRSILSLKTLALTALFVSAILCPRAQTGSDASEISRVANRDFAGKVKLPELSAPMKIWVVDHKPDYDVYSNGLRIENRFVAPNYQRAYCVYPLNARKDPVLKVSVDPAGIVFHTTESSQAPFEEDQNGQLRRITQDTVANIRLNHSYHFVIDRFGRVFRVVPETDVAFHAGKSLWADRNFAYIGLNDSFLGVAFEGQTRDVNEGNYLGAAQIVSGRLLVQMLRNKYGIPASNCITHSQVSVNTDNMRIGKHTDGAGDFPFEQLGLTDNYAEALPSIYLFGFDYDLLFLKSTGYRLWRGLFQAEELVREEAASRRIPLPAYKKVMRDKFQKIAAAVDIQSAPEEKEQ